MMSLFWALIFLSLAFSLNCSESKNQKKLPSAVLVGTVYCDTCFHKDFPKASHVMEGATVAVECRNTRSSPSFRQEVKTDNRGEFKVNLPFSVSKNVKKIEGCSVKLITSNEPYCAVAATATSTTLNLKSRKDGVHIFSTGFFTFKPLNQPQVCDQKPRIEDFKKQSVEDGKSSMVSNANDPAFLQPVQDPPYNPPVLGQLPPLPRLPPLPQLPQLPPLPRIPYLPPLPDKETAIKSPKSSGVEINPPVSSKIPLIPNPLNPPLIPNPLNPPLIPNPLNPPSTIPPNPLLPPPSLLPPVVPSPPASIFPPVFPAPPATIFPPVLPAPPTPPVFKLPPIPGFTPSAPPPPSPFPIAFPPFPFQPTPGFPGVPPAAVSSLP